MKQILVSALLSIFLVGCSAYKLPPFATASQWTLDGNVASSSARDMAIDFGGGSSFPITNMGNGEYELNFITSQSAFAAYDAGCRDYVTSAIRRIPIDIDSVEFVLADRYMVITPSVFSRWMPDLVRRGDGSELVVEANPRSSYVQPHDEIWRNFIFDRKLRRIIVVDRLVKKGRHIAIAYIMQSENGKLPFTSTFHYDVTDRRNIQPVGEQMRALLDMTIAASESRVSTRSGNDAER